MAIDREFREYGVVIIPDNQPDCIQVWKNIYDMVQISAGPVFESAQWQGGSIIAHMSTGEIRRYHTLTSNGYDIVRHQQQ